MDHLYTTIRMSELNIYFDEGFRRGFRKPSQRPHSTPRRRPFAADMFAAFTVTASAVRAPCATHSRTHAPHQSARIAAFSTGAGRRELALSTARRHAHAHGVSARKIEATAHRANVQATATEVRYDAIFTLRMVRSRDRRGDGRERAPRGRGFARHSWVKP